MLGPSVRPLPHCIGTALLYSRTGLRASQNVGGPTAPPLQHSRGTALYLLLLGSGFQGTAVPHTAATHSKVTFPFPVVSNCLIAVRTSSVLRSEPTVIIKSCSNHRHTQTHTRQEESKNASVKNTVNQIIKPTLSRRNKKKNATRHTLEQDSTNARWDCENAEKRGWGGKTKLTQYAHNSNYRASRYIVSNELFPAPTGLPAFSRF